MSRSAEAHTGTPRSSRSPLRIQVALADGKKLPSPFKMRQKAGSNSPASPLSPDRYDKVDSPRAMHDARDKKVSLPLLQNSSPPGRQSPARSYQRRSPERKERIAEVGYKESELNEAPKEAASRDRGRDSSSRRARRKTIGTDQEELMQMLQEGVKTGRIHLLERPTSMETVVAKQVQDVKDLIEMVKVAESAGHCRILRRKSTDSIALPGDHEVKLIPQRSQQP